MYIDPHVHTSRYSACSRLSPEELIQTARLLGLDGVVITEHNYIWEAEELAELLVRLEVSDLVVLRGQEVRVYYQGEVEGDVLVFGVEESFAGEVSAEELVQRVHRAGGVLVAAHPFRGILGLGEAVFELELDGIETLNTNHNFWESHLAEAAKMKTGLPGLGGSDAHSLVAVGNFLTYFERPVQNEAELAEEIRRGRCRAVSYYDIFKA